MDWNSIVFILILIVFGSCKNTKTVSDSSQQPTLKMTEIVVQLKGKVKPDQVEGAYQMYKVVLLEEIDKANNVWIFGFDQTSIQPTEMLKILTYSQFVAKAAFKEE